MNIDELKQTLKLAFVLCLLITSPVHGDWKKYRTAYEGGDYAYLLAEAEQRNYSAFMWVGMMYDYGKGVEKDDNKASEYYLVHLMSFDPPHPFVLYRMAYMHLEGRGIAKQDTAIAVKRFRESAEQGYVPAQIELGNLYLEGSGTIQNFNEAVIWYYKASEQGSPYAQWRLGVMYQYGLGVKQDSAEAHKWYNLSAAQGNAEGKELRDKIGKDMTIAEISEAHCRASEWIEKNEKEQ